MNYLIPNRKILASLLAAVFLLSVLLVSAPVRADPETLYVDDDYPNPGACDNNAPCYSHPQDAVNAANPGDTIKVYPGIYGSREAPHSPPHWGPGDWFAPALIVYKDGLTIEAVDPNPANTVIQSTHNFWSNPVAIQWSTGGTFHPGPHGWDAYYTTPPGITPTFGSAPNAVAIVASDVTIRGFTFHRHYEGTSATYNTAGVMIGGLCAGCTQFLGSNDNTVENCEFSDVWHAVYIWHSSGNKITNNNVAALSTDHWAAISTYDGYNDEQINLGHPSENNIIVHNTLANKGIALGAWAPSIWTSNAGSQVCCNTATQVGVTYAHGPVIVGCNTGAGFWQSNTDNVLRVKGIQYTGDTTLWGSGSVPVSLKAGLSYGGTADGSGVEVVFTVDDTTYPATTVAGGIASTTANLVPGIYTVKTKAAVCEDCEVTDTDPLTIGQLLSIDIKPGSYPNSINLKSKGVVPVAVLGTSDFDVATVDPSSVRFAGASPDKWSLQDVNGDGVMDLVLQFKTKDLISLTSSSTQATLTGTTYGGIPVEGTDTVNIVPK